MAEKEFFLYFLLALIVLLLIVIAYMAYLLGKRKVLLESMLNGSPTSPTNRRRNLQVPMEQGNTFSKERSCVQDESIESVPGTSALPKEIVYAEPNHNALVFYMKRLGRNILSKPTSTTPLVKIVDGSVKTGNDSNRSSDPLPKVTYARVQPKHLRNGNIERYDVSVNNSFIHRAKKTFPYNYNFSANSKTPPRKYSLEHIYDETQYPPLSEISSTTDKKEETDETDANYSKPMMAK